MASSLFRSLVAGSSPRVRGKRAGDGAQPHVRGLIPARAGKTPLEYQRFRVGTAHPRACGENTTSAAPSALPRGSSPRVRGKHPDGLSRWLGARLIPARAGKTRLHKMHVLTIQAHPRACGENFTKRDRPHMSNGSSPRVRGKQPRAVRAVGRCRLIPARAGKTRRVGHPRPPSPAHPRACGENKCMSLQSTRSVGSSPRVRGKRTAPEGGLPRCRLIPARAGKTFAGAPYDPRFKAHPRACGENWL